MALLRRLASRVDDGRFQRSLALVAGGAGLLSGLEVTSQHYRGSFGQKVMYSPVLLSSALFAAGLAGAVSPRAARTVLPAASALLLADGVVGFGFHVRGLLRKPGGLQQLVTNVCMGPPIFAPLLLGIGGVVGLVASTLDAEETPRWRLLVAGRSLARRAAVRRGTYARGLGAAMTVSALLNGVESLYSHYKPNFPYKVQWLPVALTPALVAAGIGAWVHPRSAPRYLPAASLVAIGAGSVGFFFHARGVVRRPGGTRQLLYNLVYGPPVFAPLLYAATGFLGLLSDRMNPHAR